MGKICFQAVSTLLPGKALTEETTLSCAYLKQARSSVWGRAVLEEKKDIHVPI